MYEPLNTISNEYLTHGQKRNALKAFWFSGATMHKTCSMQTKPTVLDDINNNVPVATQPYLFIDTLMNCMNDQVNGWINEYE